MKCYLVGIKGTGMSALALALKSNGEIVTGSDKDIYFFTEDNLLKNDINILTFNENNIKFYLDYTFIVSYAYDEDNNEELRMLRKLNIKYYYYSEFINEYFKGIKIGVCGSHGKTSVCKLLSSFLKKCSYIIGDGSGYSLPDYDYFVFEACEYKNHFLNYDYDFLIINNIDFDHPDYFHCKNDYVNSFFEVSKKAKCIIVNGDCEECKRIKHKNKFTFGFNKGNFCLINIIDTNINGYKVQFKINKDYYYFDLPFYGKHMLYNFANVVVFFYLNKLNILDIDISKFVMPKLRMEERSFKSNILIDDYAHHPSEIKCLLKAIKHKYPSYEIVSIFQPHTYSRTFEFKKEFANLFDDVYECFITKTFTSREKFDKFKERKVKRIFKKCKYITDDDYKRISKYEKKLIVFIGAGDIHSDKLISFS